MRRGVLLCLIKFETTRKIFLLHVKPLFLLFLVIFCCVSILAQELRGGCKHMTPELLLYFWGGVGSGWDWYVWRLVTQKNGGGGGYLVPKK